MSIRLEIGQYYRIKQEIKCKASENKLKYCGIEHYNNEKKFSFFDESTRLFHWINPDYMEAT